MIGKTKVRQYALLSTALRFHIVTIYAFFYTCIDFILLGNQIEIVLGKTEKFDELMAAAAEERSGNGEEQS